jgi:5-methylcytosine-specific restriction endonuclease McrA
MTPSARTLQYRARRAALILQLGGKCELCRNTVNLEFDCRTPRGHRHHLIGSLARIRFYELEASAGNLQLLCTTCHRVKTKNDRSHIVTKWIYEI